LRDVKSRLYRSRYLNNESLAIKNGKLLIYDRTIPELLKNYTTPLYVFLEDQVRKNCRVFIRLLSKYFKYYNIYYSFKTNYLQKICDIISQEGLGAEVVSISEMELARTCKSKKTIFSGIYISDSILNYVKEYGIETLVISQIKELSRVNTFMAENGLKQEIAIRLKSFDYSHFSGIEYTPETFKKMLKLLSVCENLKLTMLHYHIGTQILKNEPRIKHIKYILDVYEKFENAGFKIPKLNLGGGFPEAGVFSEDDLSSFLNSLKDILQENWDKIEINFEPGRYIVGNTGLLLMKVHNTFQIGKENWILVDAGDHILPKASKSNFRFIFTDKLDKPHKNKISIKGCLPTDIDILAKNYPSPAGVSSGDIIAVANAGAYTLTWSFRFSFPLPAVILINKNGIEELKPQGNKNELYY